MALTDATRGHGLKGRAGRKSMREEFAQVKELHEMWKATGSGKFKELLEEKSERAVLKLVDKVFPDTSELKLTGEVIVPIIIQRGDPSNAIDARAKENNPTPEAV